MRKYEIPQNFTLSLFFFAVNNSNFINTQNYETLGVLLTLMEINIEPKTTTRCLTLYISKPMSYAVGKKKTERVFQLSPFQYPDPGSNRDGLPHWCLRPARLPIPPSGQLLNCECKGSAFFYCGKQKRIFFEKKLQMFVCYAEKK